MTEVLYRQLADEVARRIDEGVYRPGERLPSIRGLAGQRGVSIATVQAAYELLESRRLVESRPQSGFYVRHPVAAATGEPPMGDGPVLPTTVSVRNEATAALQRCEADGVLNLGAALPAPEFLPRRQLQRILSRLARHHIDEIVMARFAPGLDALRQEVVKRLADAGCHVSPREVVITNGCQEALNLCLRTVARPGDTIAIEGPAYVGLLQAIESLGMKALEIPTDPRDGVSLEALALALEQWDVRACAFVTTNSNPVGASMPDEAKQRLVAMLAARGIPLVEDDEFGDLNYNRTRPRAAKAFDEHGLVLYCSSASKSIGSGLRVGWCAPGRFENDVEFLKSFSSVSSPPICQMAVAEFMASGGYERHIRRLQSAYAEQVQRFIAAISRAFPRGTTVTRPRGGYVLWVGLPGGVDAAVFHERALAEGIGVMPGHLFSAAGGFRQFIRLNAAVPWDEAVETAIAALGRLAVETAGTLRS
ncbi:PLP-dependent aminotransferase family protein [Arhodomonas aquaeolei]|uniref:aminotransferase-like domain-containing protein n=1 Tax=Arhodomonas aquaeolei TaxID=2369 RepID=UPI0003812998|nr:PLP-dependent aminotransferase family protein [Arhodomonas aquaeolei]